MYAHSKTNPDLYHTYDHNTDNNFKHIYDHNTDHNFEHIYDHKINHNSEHIYHLDPYPNPYVNHKCNYNLI